MATRRRRAGWGFRARPGTKHVRINLGRRPGSVLPRISSVSLKAGWFTYNTRSGRTSVNPPGPGSVWVDTRRPQVASPGQVAQRAPRGNVVPLPVPPVDPEWERWCIDHRRCPVATCGSEIKDVCRTPKTRKPTKTHPARMVPEPARPAPASARVAATLRRLLGWLAVAALLVLVAPHVNLLPW